MIWLLSLMFIFIIALEVPALIKKKLWRELTTFSVLLLIGMIYSYGQLLDLPLPNPTDGIEAVFKPVGEYLQKLLS